MSRHHCHGRRWRRLRLVVLERAGYRCENCGRAGRLEVDHRRALQLGGDPWALENLQALCRECHAIKTRAERPRAEGPMRRRWREFVAELASG